MILLGSAFKLYLEIGGVTLFAWLCFTACRRASETFGGGVSPSLMIRIAQALMVCSITLSLVAHAIPEPKKVIANFEVSGGKGELLNKPSKEAPTAASQGRRAGTSNSHLNQIGILKQRLLYLIESLENRAVSFGLCAVLLLGWILMSTRLNQQTTSLRELLERAVIIRKIGRTRILVTDEITIPFSTLLSGIAFVVLPMSMADEGENFKLATLHELQHHRRRDTAWARLIEFGIVLYFWNPAIYLWKKEIIQLQEFACDETLIGQRRVSPHQYGSCLLKVAEAALVRHDMRIGTICMAVSEKNPNRHVSFLRRRIDMFSIHKDSKRRTALGLTLGTASLLLTAAVAYGAQQTFKTTENLAPNPGEIRFDPAIQSIAETTLTKYVRKFNATAGFVLISEVSTGRLLASANISDNPKAATNWALSYELEPASAMKVPLVASALEDGVTAPDETHDCANGVAKFGHGTYRDWKPFGRLTTSESLIQSSNICSIRITQKLGSSGVARSMNDFGFGLGGTTTGFPQARAGEIPDPSLYPADDYVSVVTVGLNAVPHFHVTPLEILQAVGALANEGRLMKPLLADAPDSSIGMIRQVVSQKTANEMKVILRRVVLEGTGRSAQSSLYTTAGKTSSAFAPSSKDHDETGGERAMAGFVGFAPVGDPKIAVYVGVFEPHEKSDPNAHGNRHAGPVFKEVIETTLQHLNVAPDATASKN